MARSRHPIAPDRLSAGPAQDPDRARSQHGLFPGRDHRAVLRIAATPVALREPALAGLLPDRRRRHICRGRTKARRCDIAMDKTLPLSMRGLARCILSEPASPRLGEAWTVVSGRAGEIPEGTVPLPGAVDTTTASVGWRLCGRRHARPIAARRLSSAAPRSGSARSTATKEGTASCRSPALQ